MKLNSAMMNETRCNGASQRTEDLRQALGRQGLAELVRTALPRGRERVTDSSLLALLTYSYAAGVYGSTEIPYELADFPQLLGAECKVDQHVLRQFRRQNHSELRDCLSRVLRTARGSCESNPMELSSGRWPEADRDGCEQEAEERISRAVRADTFALDD